MKRWWTSHVYRRQSGRWTLVASDEETANTKEAKDKTSDRLVRCLTKFRGQNWKEREQERNDRKRKRVTQVLQWKDTD